MGTLTRNRKGGAMFWGLVVLHGQKYESLSKEGRGLSMHLVCGEVVGACILVTAQNEREKRRASLAERKKEATR